MSERYLFPPLRFGACVSAEAATDFTAFDDFGSRSSFDALVATVLDVFSFGDFRVAMPFSLFAKCKYENSHRSDMEKGGNHGSPLVHRHSAIDTGAPQPVNDNALVHSVDVIVARVLAEGGVGQIGGALVQRIGNFVCHGRSVQRGFGSFNSHFPSPDSFVYDCTVVVGNANKNVRGAHA
ncbi:hypothetical protein G5B41_17650 [bacterium SGD-2]|nr:hypothetical protein [bacterium SGD-2]